jgi:hypothetical protein
MAVFEAETGAALSWMALSSQPVFDGMSAANQRIYISLKNGSVVCYGGN